MILAVTLIAWTFGLGSPNQAETCEMLTRNCLRNGGAKERCYAPERMAYCKKTCEMIDIETGRSAYARAGCGGQKSSTSRQN